MATKKSKPRKREPDPRLVLARLPREVYKRVKALANERHTGKPWVAGELLEAALDALEAVEVKR